MGLINRVVPRNELEGAAPDLARVMADKSPAAVKIGKRAFYEQAEMTLSDAYTYAGNVMAKNMMAADAAAGTGAFTRKEPMPTWTGA
jgi:enoyl-CoA hydratase/carnithine racemase